MKIQPSFFGCGAVAVSRILGVRKCRFREKWTRGRVDRVSLHGSSRESTVDLGGGATLYLLTMTMIAIIDKNINHNAQLGHQFDKFSYFYVTFT